MLQSESVLDGVWKCTPKSQSAAGPWPAKGDDDYHILSLTDMSNVHILQFRNTDL